MTPDLPIPLNTKVPSTSAWLALAIVLTAMLALGRQTQSPVFSATARQTALGRPAPAVRRVALVHPAGPAAGASAASATAAL